MTGSFAYGLVALSVLLGMSASYAVLVRFRQIADGAALRRSEEKFSKAFRSSPVEIVITTLEEGRFLEVNETFERNIRFTREEVLGRSAIELGLWADPSDRASMVEEIKRNGRVVNREIEIRTKSGEVGFKLYSAELIEIGGEQCLLATSEDITDRKRAQENLLRSEAFLSEGQRQTHTGSWAWNPSSGEVYWSRETFRIFGLDPLTTHPSLELFYRCVHPEDLPGVERQIERSIREKSSVEFDYRIVLADDSVKYIHAMGHPVFKASGEFLEFIGTAMDVTERKRTEEELQRLSSQLLRLHDEERRNIARDLHDTTGQDLVALSALLGQIRSSLPPSNRKSRKLLAQSQDLLDRSIREVRTLSYVLHPPMLDETGLEDAIRYYLKGYVDRTGIAVDFEVPPDFGRIRQDMELALFRVVQESLINAHRHSGTFTAKVRLARDPGVVWLEVIDYGRGIAGFAEKKFGRDYPGGGVGLLSMQERIKQVGGHLEIASSSEGTTVRVEIIADE